MKRFLLSVALATTLALTSCQFDDSDIWDKFGEMEESIRDHEQRISALEELCKQMNTNIEALQTLVDALEKRDYVTNVAPIREDGVVIGYTISFAYSDTITIYHGKDGKDGVNGTDGYTPQIGVMKDPDGFYYWTLDGEWLLDEKGDKIQANGVNGTNGVTPQLKIENDYWYVSYDNGATWQQLGKATGEDGQDGSTFFQSVTEDDKFVYFNLSDGTMITLPKHDKENIQFEDLQVKAFCCKNWDTNNDGELSYAEAAAVETIGTVFQGNTNIIAFTELKYFTGITEIPESAFQDCAALWKIVLPPTITHIRVLSFCNCTFLQSITIPNSVTSIGNIAFSGCSSLKAFYGKFASADNRCLVIDGVLNFFAPAGLTEYTIPNSVTSIGRSAFSYCSSLTSVTIPDSVTSIGYAAFADCPSLTSVYCKPTTPPTGNGSMFENTASNLKIYVPRNSVSAYKAAAYWKTYASYIEGYEFE